jgi:hypothetical protein
MNPAPDQPIRAASTPAATSLLAASAIARITRRVRGGTAFARAFRIFLLPKAVFRVLYTDSG